MMTTQIIPFPMTGTSSNHGLRGLDVMDIVAELRAEDAFSTDGRNARTLVHDGPARVVVSVVDVGRRIGGETSDGHVALMVLEGRASLVRGADRTEIAPDTLALLAPGEGWSLQADSPFACLACFWQPVAETGAGGPEEAGPAPAAT